MSGHRGQLHLGTVTGTHGVRGGLRVRTFSGEYEVLASLKTVQFRLADGTFVQFEVEAVRGQGRHAVLSLKGFDSINLVAGLVGSQLLVDRNQLPPLPDGEYYWCDLLGMTVVLDDGSPLGEITDIIATGSNDVYVVKSGEREVLVPAIEDVVLNIDPVAGEMRVALLEGLLDT